jgi:SAM-dependent methyltransferase
MITLAGGKRKMTAKKWLDSITLETCPCPLCGEEDSDETSYRSGDVAVVRCASCRVWYLSPRPTAESMAAVYAQGGYFEGAGTGYESYKSQARALRATFRSFVRALQRCGITGKALLEVGCGYGYLLEEAKPYFDTCVGCDFSADAIRQITCTDQLFVGGPAAVPEDLRFQCIIATHVIEHIHDPVPFVRDLANRLDAGGWLVLAAPHMGSIWRKFMQSRWPSFKYPEHVVFYDRATLPRLLRAAGLEVTQPIPYPHAFPLSLVCEKVGIGSPCWLQFINVWLPATTIAVAGQRPWETQQ